MDLEEYREKKGFGKTARQIIFYKGRGLNIVGPNDYIGKRSDSVKTLIGQELTLVLASDGKILGFTAGGDVTALDDPDYSHPVLHHFQGKMFRACCSIGPALVTPDEIDPYDVAVVFRIFRSNKKIFE